RPRRLPPLGRRTVPPARRQPVLGRHRVPGRRHDLPLRRPHRRTLGPPEHHVRPRHLTGSVHRGAVVSLMTSVCWVIARGLVVAAALATLVSCGNSDDSTGAKASAPQSTGSSAGPVGSPMITPSPTSATPTPPTPSTTRPPVQTAKDGQNYKACSDGNCEVLIR